MRQRHHTTYDLVTDGGDVLEIPFEIDEYSVKWTESADGLTGYLGACAQDTDCEDPFDTGIEGELVVFDTSKIHSGSRPEIADFKRIIRENPGRVCTVNFYEHSLSSYSYAAGPFTVADTKDQDKKNHTMSRDEYQIQGCYDRSTGWETVNTEETSKDARRSLREYRENDPTTPHRLIKRRVPVTETTEEV